MRSTQIPSNKGHEAWSWQRLQGLVSDEVLAAPRVDWERVDGRCIRYLLQRVAGFPWLDNLAFLTAVLTSHAGLDARTILNHLQSLHPRWRMLFPLELHRQLSRRTELDEAAKRRRKAETDAMTPQFARIRGQAHLRWNALHRLRLKFQEAVSLVQSGREALPLAISFEEFDGLQRLHFVLWDRPSFVLAHADQYCAATVQHVRARVSSFEPDQNHHFLEFRRIEYLRGAIPEPDEFLWFGDLLKNGLLGRAPGHGRPEEVRRKQECLRSWGYGQGDESAQPFASKVAGLLAWPKAQFRFMVQAQQRTEGLLVPVEPLFAAATFGLAALDLFTTTGARMNELMQVSLTSECLHTLVVEGVQRLVLRMVPKGSDKLADYFVGPETQRNLEKVARLLREHYHLQAGEPTPAVRFDPENGRSHRFPARPVPV